MRAGTEKGDVCNSDGTRISLRSIAVRRHPPARWYMSMHVRSEKKRVDTGYQSVAARVTRLFASPRQPRQPPRIPEHSGTRKSLPSFSLSLSSTRKARNVTGRSDLAMGKLPLSISVQIHRRSLIDSKEETFLQTSVQRKEFLRFPGFSRRD